MAELKFKTTKDIKVPKELINQVIGQEDAVRVIKKAAAQRRNVFLIGEPGTGKSMLGLALAELLPKENLEDTLTFFNPNDENQPLVRTMPAGKGRELVARERVAGMKLMRGQNFIFIVFIILSFLVSSWTFSFYSNPKNIILGKEALGNAVYGNTTLGAIMFLTSVVSSLLLLGFISLSLNLSKRMGGAERGMAPKLIVDNFNKKQVPFIDATGAHAGALLGDVLHDPFQSGGLGTPAHERVVAGMIHKTNKGVLFIDEIATLQPMTQQDLLSALQEKRYAITGQSERSAGAMVRTEPVPCDFVLIAAGNLETIKHMHPALRSRIRGYGYEVYMRETMKDTLENREKLIYFVAQEIQKDKKIPAFSREAVLGIIEEARRRANRKGHLTLRLRDLGGLIRAAGDVAVEEKADLVLPTHVLAAKKIAKKLEEQIADKFIESKKEYEVIIVTGERVGRVNGLAVIGGGDSYSGIILPIEAEITPGGKEREIIATGKLGEIAKEAVKNVSAIVKRYFGVELKGEHDIYVQFLQTYEGVEGDSASIAVATAIISALKKIPIRQDTAMTGSLSVRGEVLPVGGVTSKVEAAIEAGIKRVIVPNTNIRDIIIAPDDLKKIQLIPVSSINQVLREALVWKGNEDILKKIERNHGSNI